MATGALRREGQELCSTGQHADEHVDAEALVAMELGEGAITAVSYTHLTLPTTPYV